MRNTYKKRTLSRGITERFKRYVLIFPFVNSNQEVLLVRKRSPEWQRGKLNGIGGKIDESFPDRISEYTAVRQLKVEAGIGATLESLQLFAMITDEYTYHVDCYRLRTHLPISYQGTGTEDVARYGFPQVLTRKDLVSPVQILLPMALDMRILSPVRMVFE